MAALEQMKTKLYCLKQGHINQTIDYICVDDECENNQLCCFLCQQQMHSKHQMESLKVLLGRVIDTEIKYQELLALSASMDATAIDISKFLIRFKNQFTDANSVNNSFEKYLQGKRKNAISILSLSQQLQKIAKLKVNDFQRQLKYFLTKYSVYFEKDEKDKGGAKDIYTKNLNDLTQDLKGIKNTLQKLAKQNKLNDYQALVLFPVEQCQVKSFKPHFLEAYHGPCMKTTATTAQMKTSSSQRVLALDPSLQKGNKVRKWKIKITKLASWIGIGACHINKLKQANWFFNYSNTQHGSYFISSNGYCWSSFKPQYNSKFESFSFKTGDTIKVEFNPRERKLKYEKDGTGQTYSIDVDINGDLLHPAINLTGVGDAVEIVP